MKITYFASKSMYKLFYLSKLFMIKCLKMQFKMFFGVFFAKLSAVCNYNHGSSLDYRALCMLE